MSRRRFFTLAACGLTLVGLSGAAGTARADFAVTGSVIAEHETAFFGLTTGCPFGCTLWYETTGGSATQGDCAAGADHYGTAGSASVGTFNHWVYVGLCDDNVYEYGSETIQLRVSDRADWVGAKTATAEVQDNEPVPSVSVANASAAEGTGPLTFTFSKPQRASREVNVTYTTESGGAIASEDFEARSGTVTWSALDNANKTVMVPVVDDARDEQSEEGLKIKITGITEGNDISNSEANGTITDNDTAPGLSIADLLTTEGNLGLTDVHVPVTLSAPSALPISVNYATTPGTASGGLDFIALGPTSLSFAPGETQKTATVQLLGDSINELDEQLTLTLSSPTNATLTKSTGIVTIDNDDAPLPAVGALDVAVTEGNGGPVKVEATVQLSHPHEKAVSVDYAVADGTAAAPADYLPQAAATLHIPQGQTSAAVVIEVLGDGTDEPNETVQLVLQNPTQATLGKSIGVITILDDDLPPEIDVDGDGFSPEEGDCSDTNVAINPVAQEIPGNQVDENCDQIKAPFPVVSSSVNLTGQRHPGRPERVDLLTLTVLNLERADRVAVSCSPRRLCAKKLRAGRTIERPIKKLKLDKQIAGRWVLAGGRLSVSITRGNHGRRTQRFRMKRTGRVPWTASTWCLLPHQAGRDPNCDGWPG